MLKTSDYFRLFHYWLIYIGVIFFLICLGWDTGILNKIFATDPTRITYVIALFFICGTLHCALRAYFLSNQLNSILGISNRALDLHKVDSLPAKFLQAALQTIDTHQSKNNESTETDKQLLTDVFAEQAHGQHEIGWFISGLLVKLGLLGTVIGFVLMLQPLATLESFDLADIQGILANMTAGMSVALNTTLLGLLASMFLGFQYLLLDRGADELVSRTVFFMQTELNTNS